MDESRRPSSLAKTLFRSPVQNTQSAVESDVTEEILTRVQLEQVTQQAYASVQRVRAQYGSVAYVYEEHQKYTMQFATLKPVNGYITGDQGRIYFLQFGLPASVLAQIWNLADLTSDGKLDRREFCIAMHLIGKALAGFQLPIVLPESLKMESLQQTAFSTSTISPVPFVGGPIGRYSTRTVRDVPPPTASSIDWTIPSHMRLKYSQEFNAIDTSRTGFLSGIQARNILTQCNLPTQTLAQLWNLADVDKDGRLSSDEYCIAMFLVDKLKCGELTSLPLALPSETLATLQGRQRTTSAGSVGATDLNSIRNDSALASSNSEPRFAVTFEDKRRENFDKGQAELERRRQILLEQEKPEKEERERKEREEAEKQMRERLEAERKRQAEVEFMLAKQREEEMRREEEYRKALEQREAARREIERQRQVELEKQRLHELIVQRTSEQDSVIQLRQKQKQLQIHLESLADKTIELDNSITSMREQIISVTSVIESMKEERDAKLSEIESYKLQLQELNSISARNQLELKSLSSQQARLQHGSTSEMENFSAIRRQKSLDLENLRLALADVERQIGRHPAASFPTPSQSEAAELRDAEAAENRQLINKITNLRKQLIKRRHSTSRHVTSNDRESLSSASSAISTVKYRALYEFVARSEDELSFQPGDIILVFKSHSGEPGWLTGQIKDKVGWFPEAFTEPMDAPVADPFTESGSPQHSSTKLESIHEEGTERDSEVTRAVHTQPKFHANGSAGGRPQTAVALFQWKAKKDNHLSFNKGDVINVLEIQEMWWMGELAGQTGWFPKSYVKLADATELDRRKSEVSMDDQQSCEKVKPTVKKFDSQEFPSQMPDIRQGTSDESFHPDPFLYGSGTGKSLNDLFNDNPGSANEKPTSDQWYVAIYPFPEMEVGDLRFESGDRIFVTKKQGEWWTGKCGGRTGMFPATYVQPAPLSESFSAISKSTDSPFETVQVLFDYAAQQSDELNLKAGDLVKVFEKVDEDWWQGETASGQRGLFPATYVQSTSAAERLCSLRDTPEQMSSNAACMENGKADPSIVQDERVEKLNGKGVSKRAMYCQELLQTERNFADDLQMVRQVFYKQIQDAACLSPEELGQMFLNWDELLKGSKTLFKTLRQHGEDRIRHALLQSRQIFDAFLTFCREQQTSLDLLESKIKTCKKFQLVHTRCSQHPAARGLPLSHFLLLPVTRVTKYPLVLKEILKHTPEGHIDRIDLTESLEFLKNVCEQVDRLANEMQNLQMLYWCQNHVKCDGLLQPKLVFHSETNCSGWRKMLHSGVLFKDKSNRLLIGLLFNDLLMFTTPDESIDKPLDFKLTRHSDLTLSMYKQPMLLRKASLQLALNLTGVDPGDDTLFALKNEESVISLKALSSNNRLLWTKQLDKAIKQAKQDYANHTCPLIPDGINGSKAVVHKGTMGRLLMDVVSLRNVHIPAQSKSCPLFLVLTVGDGQRCVKLIDCNNDSVPGDCGVHIGSSGTHAPSNALVSTQFLIENVKASCDLKIFVEHLYAPNVCLGRAQISVEDMLRMSGSQKNPAIKQLPLWPLSDSCSIERGSEGPSGHVVVKFVVQMLDVA